MNKQELRQIIKEEIQKLMSEDINADKYKKLAGEMLELVKDIVDDYLEDYDSEEDEEVIDSINSEDGLIKFYKGVLKNLKAYEVNGITISDIKKEVKKLFSKNNIEIK